MPSPNMLENALNTLKENIEDSEKDLREKLHKVPGMDVDDFLSSLGRYIDLKLDEAKYDLIMQVEKRGQYSPDY